MKPVSRHVHADEAEGKAFQMNTTPRIAAVCIVNGRIKSNAHAYFERQGRPQAHLDRVMMLGRESPPKRVEFREGSMRTNIKRYGSNGPPPRPGRPPPPPNPPRKPA